MFREIMQPATYPRFRRVWLGELVNIIGDAVFTVAVALYVLPRKDAPRALGLVLGLAAVGGIVSLLVGGALADRYRRSRVIIVSDIIQAIAVAGVVLVGHNASLVTLGAFAALLGIGSGLYRPAYSAILPSLVSEELIPKANSLSEIASRLGVIVGAAIGGVIASATSPSWALLADVVTFLVSITTLAGLSEEPPRVSVEKQQSLGADIADGFRYVLGRPWMTGVMLQGTAQMALVAAPIAILLPLLTGPQGWFGYITAAEAAGAFCGASVASAIKSRSPGWWAMLALLAQLPQLVLLALRAAPALILVASILTGMGLAVFAVLWTTALQTGVPQSQLGRVFSLDQLTVVGLMPAGYLLAGWLLGTLGASTLAWTAAAVLVASVLIVLPLPGLRRLADQKPIAQDLVREPSVLQATARGDNVPGKIQPPECLLAGMHGEKDKRGFLVTHVVYREEDGTPILKLADVEKAASCMAERRCQTCGEQISPEEKCGFIGFPEETEFREAPIHLRCAAYSFATCPHLLARTRDNSVIIAVCDDYEYILRSADEVLVGTPARCRPYPMPGPVIQATLQHPAEVLTLTPTELSAYLSA